MTYTVTPHAGVWIEMTRAGDTAPALAVTPHAGVWIEILVAAYIIDYHRVTPHAGVWIEILLPSLSPLSAMSLPTRECGLKFTRKLYQIVNQSHSPRGSVD